MGGPAGDNGNDLEPAALVVAPELVRWRDEVADRRIGDLSLRGVAAPGSSRGHSPTSDAVTTVPASERKHRGD